MCIRDSGRVDVLVNNAGGAHGLDPVETATDADWETMFQTCLLYTSDAADERSSVDLGGRRIIKKKKNAYTRGEWSEAQKNARDSSSDRRSKPH